MKVEFVHYADGDLLYKRDDLQHIPSVGEELELPSGEYKVIERSFHYLDEDEDCIVIWIKGVR